ncbi:hypothetical protein OFO10_02645 [Campylobacter sp. VBCF_06 NA8]|uniref:hypothetical protein n=1 Tax=Campylobacter sp. VBCF_06 NA8 TaxID=2983822 RepID=UPI0022E99C03|nr:hypothetical protein [Campylobacter sp. VBCF_06 NA8]MDA3046051.1 hypothetical protein [Campylobacter sp. VBCF_06 NA8]
MKSKKLIFVFFGFFGLLFAVLVTIIFISDPLRIFHKPIICKNSIETNLRLGNYTLINNYDFDSIILGSSMLDNTSAKEASQILGEKFINLSIDGSDYFERELILNYILNIKNKNIKKIIFSLDTWHFLNQNKGNITYPPHKFDFLYDNKKFNDYKVYFDKYMLTKTLERFIKCENVNLDRPNAWFEIEDQYSRFGGFENWIKNKNNSQIRQAFDIIKNNVQKIKNGEIQSLENLDEQILKSKNYVDEYILKFVSQNPQTEFYLVLPPYSRIHNAIEFHTKKRDFLVTKEVLRYLVEQSKTHKNLKIYAWGDTDYPDNIANYKDLTHYSHKFNSLMLEYLRDGTGLLTPQNFDEYYAKFEQKSREFDLMPYYEKIK